MVEEATSKFYKLAELIVAIRCTNDELALIKTASSGDGALLQESYSVVGAGRPVFEYWAQYFLRSGQINLEIASHLMMFMFRETKGAGKGCGGQTELYKMSKKTGSLAKTMTLWGDSKILAGFPQTTAEILLDVLDLNRADSEYENKIENLKQQVMGLRAHLRMREQFKRGVYTATSNVIMVHHLKDDETGKN